MIRHLFLLLAFLMSFQPLWSQDSTKADQKMVYIFDIDEEIAPPVSRRMEKAWKDAKEKQADLILIHMNTYGGLVVDADTIRTRILNSSIPVIVFIDNNAASAGALISIACDKIYMRKSANIGAATVVNQTAEAMPDKYQSYMRATMRSTAEATGRDPKIAEAMVDQDIYIENIIDSGKVLTFTASEAYQHGFCDSIVESIDEVLAAYGIEDYRTEELHLTSVDKVIDFLISPYIHGILIMIIIGGIYFELQSPGMGFPSIAAILAAILYFMPLYLEGLAANWEILVFFLGIGLLFVEFFAFPGFGIAGIGGILLIVFGLMASMLNNVNFDFSNVPMEAIATSFIVVVFAMLAAIVLIYYLAKGVFGGWKFSLALQATQPHEEGFVATTFDMESMIGKEGVAITMLRPSGKIEIDDDQYDAISKYSFIEMNERIKVVGMQNTQLVVEKLED
jgi:membrane-bound serine protease (ClpP class)